LTALPAEPSQVPSGHALDSALGLVATLVAVVGAALLIGDAAPGWGAVLVLAGSCASLARAVRWRSLNAVGVDLVLRYLVPIAVASGFAAPGAGRDVLAWTTASVAIILAAAEQLLTRVERRRRLWVSGLPGVPEHPAQRLPAATTGLCAVLSSGIGAVLCVAGASPAGWAVAVLLSCLAACAVLAERLSHVRLERRVRARVAGAVADYAPEFVLYNARPDDASYQIAMWLPYFRRVGRRFVVVVRQELPARALAAMPELADVPVICARTSRELEDLLVPSLTTVFYVNAASGNGQMVRHADLAHVHIGHGDSDKATSFNPTHAMYDRVFLAGDAAVARYAANGVSIPRSRLQVVGRPQVERIEASGRPLAEIAEPTVLYAPTWRGDAAATELYSLPVAERLVLRLLDRGCRVIFRPHPYSHQNPEDEAFIRQVQALLGADRSRTGREHLYGAAAERERDVFDCFNDSDAMVCDVSSVAVDFLQSRKPMAMYVPASSEVGFEEQFPVARGCYLLDAELTRVDEALDSLLGADPLREAREQVRASYLGDFPPASYADVFVSAVEQVVTEGVSRADEVEALDTADTDEDVTNFGGDDELSPPASGSGDAQPAIGDAAAVSTGSRPAFSFTAGRLVYQLLDLVSVAMAALVAVLASAGVADAVVAVLVIPVLGWMCWLRPPWQWMEARRTLASFMAQRTMLAVGVAALVAREGTGHHWLAAATFGVLAGLLGTEYWTRPLRATARVQVANLPGITYGSWRTGLHRAVFPITLSLLIVMYGTTLLPVPSVTGLVLGATVLAAALVVFGADLVVVHTFDEAEEDLAGAVAAYAPQFVLYFAAAKSAAYQAEMWIPYLERIGRRFIVVTRTSETFEPLVAMTSAPVVVRPTLRSLDAVMAPSLSTAFYVNNGLKNTHFVERRALTHVWLNHGDSEKPACFNPVHAIYDKLFVAGQAGIDRYARHNVDIPAEKFEIVGRPQVELIQSRPATAAAALAADGVATEGAVAGPTVLYAPTWIGPFADSAVYSLPVGVPIVQALLDRGCRVIFRAHPLNYNRAVGTELVAEVSALLAADAASTGREHIWGAAAEVEMSLPECFNLSDAMIADVSAVVSDYLFSSKPFAVVAMGSTSERLVETAPVAAAAYIISESLEDLDESLQNLLVDDPLAEQRRSTRTYYLGNFDSADYAEGFLRAARRQIDREPTGALESYAYAGE
jgi:CDP-glycerol glycerophosphotransferase (TagB/SpsB family)